MKITSRLLKPMTAVCKRLAFRLVTLVFAFIASSSSHAVITHHQIDRAYYNESVHTFPSVVKIVGHNKVSGQNIEGTGVLIRSKDNRSLALLTAAHVLESFDSFDYYGMIGNKKIRLTHARSLLDYLTQRDQKSAAIALDIRLKKSYFGTRLPIKQKAMTEHLKNFGIDLALAFFDAPPDDLKTSKIAGPHSYSFNGTFGLGVGFGQTGTGGSLFGFTHSLGRKPQKRSFEALLKPAYLLKIINFQTHHEKMIPTLFSTFEAHHPGLNRPGQVSHGDSGGPIFKKNPLTNEYEVMAIIIANQPYIETTTYKNSKNAEHWFLKWIKGFFEKGSPLSSFFWQEANIYGSEAYYIDVTNTLCASWLEHEFSLEHTKKHSAASGA